MDTGPHLFDPFSRLAYHVVPKVYLAGSKKIFDWPLPGTTLDTGPVPPLPAIETLNICVPVAVVHVRGLCNGQVAMVQSFVIRIWGTAGGIGWSYRNVAVGGVPIPAEGYVLVPAKTALNPDFQITRIVMDFGIGTDSYTDTFAGERGLLHTPATPIPLLATGEKLDLDFAIPCPPGPTNPPTLASGHGMVDMVGRHEFNWGLHDMTGIGVIRDDQINGRNGLFDGAPAMFPSPSSGHFTLKNLLPGRYTAGVSMTLRGNAAIEILPGVIDPNIGYEVGDVVPAFYQDFTYDGRFGTHTFDFPYPDPTPQGTPLGDTFVMTPALVHGDILLAGPKETTACPNLLKTLWVPQATDFYDDRLGEPGDLK